MQLKTILFVLVFVFIGLLVLIMLGYLGVPPFTVIYQSGHNWISGFDAAAIVKNPATLLTAVVPTVAAAGVASTLISKAKAQVTQTKTAAQTQIGSLDSSLKNATGELETSNLNLTSANARITELQTTASSASTKATDLEKQVQSLAAQNQQLSTMLEKTPVKIIDHVVVK